MTDGRKPALALRNTEDRYGLVARGLHWSIAVLILGLLGLGWYMVGLSYYDPLYHDSLTWHRSLGLIVLALVAVRLVWKALNRQPRPVPTLTPLERWGATAVHWLLLGLMVVMPVSGYIVSTSSGDAVSVFGWVSVPALVQVSRPVADWAATVHFYTVYGTAAVVALHAAAALKHHFIDRDGVLRRMM